MKDFFGTPLAVGDTVAFITRDYRDYTLGTIESFTAKQVQVVYESRYQKLSMHRTARYPSVLIKRPV